VRIAPAILLGVVTIFFDVRAENLSFDFKDPRGVSNIAFSLDAPLESINGTAKGIAGTVLVDPDDLSTAEGKIVVATKSLVVPNPIMRMHLLSKDWLNARSNPEISFEIKKVGRVTKKGTHASEAEVTGAFTLNRVTKEIVTNAEIVYLPGKLGETTNNKVQGDLLVVRSNFKIRRSNFGIRPREFLDKVADEISLSVNIIGSAPRRTQRRR
jgi:polyisoprenoid-binding protein YceI